MQIKSKKIKVAVALSGGVDSSVACALLKKQGFEVVGFHMRLWKAKPRAALGVLNRGLPSETEKRVREIGRVLSIKVFIFDFQKEFKDYVVDYFVESYKKGITPNPCVVCNKEIKFGLLLQKAKTLGCDYLATGHYARLRQGFGGQARLLQAKCKEKDQGYFLWKLSQGQLKHILFPIGEIESKQKVRDLAKKFGLPTYKTPESNDVCFLQDTNINDFLTRHLSRPTPRPQAEEWGGGGGIVDIKGNVLGQHKGLWFYTIGQRKGIALPQGPWFVIAKVPDSTPRPQAEEWGRGTLVVSKNEKDLDKKEVRFKNTNWINQPVKFPFKAKAKIRYGAQLASCLVYKDRAIFTKSQRAITPGQSVVFYKGNELLGGGIIQ
ncbi:MAG: tRNA 2-thiouridine(34) synthase MnmA [bacterium]